MAQPMRAARIRSLASLSTQRVRNGLSKPSEYRRKKRIKDLKILRLVLSGPTGVGVKGQEELYGLVGIEKSELLPNFPKLRMEPVSFRGIEMDFGFGEKVLVILHGLPALDHGVNLLVVIALCVGHRCLLTTRGAFGGWRIWPPNALHILTYMLMLCVKFMKKFSEIWRKAKKKNMKKERKFGP